MGCSLRHTIQCSLVVLAITAATDLVAQDPQGIRISKVLDEVRRGMRALELKQDAIQLEHDVVPSDAYRLPIIGRYLDKPLWSVRASWQRFGPWLTQKESLRASLVRAGKAIGYQVRAAPAKVPRNRGLAAAIAGLGTKGQSTADIERSVRRVPEQLHPYLARLVRRIAQGCAARQAGVASLSDQEWVELRKFGSQFNTGMASLDRHKRLHARIGAAKFFSGALQIAEVLDELVKARDACPTKGAEFHAVISTGRGRVEFGGWGANSYKKDALLIVDLGGDDHYANSAGGTLYTPAKVSINIDLAGNDVYDTGVGLAQGSGMYGIGILVDCGGNDRYKSHNVSQGSGHVGVGVLWDWSGNDRYEARSVSQGAGFVGIGLLRDDGGHDTYRVGSRGQGFGTTQGIGILQERGGNDDYFAGGLTRDTARDAGRYLSMSQGFGLGYRAGSPEQCMSGGIGVLADASGKDLYRADVFGQGCAYWFAIGVLIDASGDDIYRVHNYGQGAGIHMAAGYLFDCRGADIYDGRDHAIGHGLDRAFGCFVDFSGDDVYRSTETESMGAAVKPRALALFADLSGNDRYVGGMPGCVRVPQEGDVKLWPKAFFLDLQGDDRYAPSIQGAGNGKTWVTHRFGWGADR